MRRTQWMVVAVLAAAPAAFGQEVSVNLDRSYDFSKVKSFTVQVGEPGQDPFLEKHFVSAVTQALSGKGWTPAADPASADATVVLHGKSETRKQLNAYATGGWRWGGGMGSAQLTDYRVGTIVIDIFETKSKTLVFRSSAGDELADKQEKNEKKIDKAVSKSFKDFPPGSKK